MKREIKYLIPHSNALANIKRHPIGQSQKFATVFQMKILNTVVLNNLLSNTVIPELFAEY